MKFASTTKIFVFGSLTTALLATLAACGGGGTSSGSGGSSMASVFGTVNGNATAALDRQRLSAPAHMIASLGELVVSAAHAAGVAGVAVTVDCGGGAAFSDTTNGEGRYRVSLSNVGSGTCATTFNGLPGPTIDVTPGSETEVDVTFDGSSINVVSIEQKFDNTPQLDISVDNGDDDSSGDGASAEDDDSISTAETSSDDDDDSISSAEASSDDDSSSEGTATI